MLQFLNKNAGAIQAVASTLSLLVTAVLAYITWRYVVLTRTLARAANENMELQRRATQSGRRQLLNLLRMLDRQLGNLPYSEGKAEQIRQAVTWEGNEVEQVLRLSAEVGTEACDLAGILAERLRWIKERVDEVKSTDPRLGFNWSGFPWARWLEETSKARTNVGEIGLAILNETLGA